LVIIATMPWLIDNVVAAAAGAAIVIIPSLTYIHHG